ncbi:hypothetical protein [Actinokineospora sp.]|uniref:hypothetical protein n=1 Tax=Actinokineospora sp. TaxID=1872133 RepID=UPI003D6BAECF
MSRLVTAVARVGDAADTALAAVRATPRRTGAALAVRRYRLAGIVAAIVALVLYLLAIGDIALGGRSAATWIEVVPDWTERLFHARAPYLFEPVLAIQPLPWLTVLLSPVNLVLGGLLAGLVGLNLTVAAYAAHVTSCRRTGYGRLLAALPALLTGVACCLPPFLLVLGSGTAAALLPIVVPLRMVFYPLSLVLLAITLVWGAHRLASPR